MLFNTCSNGKAIRFNISIKVLCRFSQNVHVIYAEDNRKFLSLVRGLASSAIEEEDDQVNDE